ncbi:TenA family transcriptional regulator [Spirulina subsalsa]|uniref:TenA family transcriptional regulator n=1 Tax=Spirulina subsalsa TaxID=54311 RepID=UPI000474DA69
MMLTCKTLLDKHTELWQKATIHPFLGQCKLGTIQPIQFNTWLVQDYLFVVEFTRLVGRILNAAPVEHFDSILGGLNALKDELNWFRDKATQRDLNLSTIKQATCQEYCDFLLEITEMSYPVQAVGLWAIELAYNQGWQLPGPMPEPYAEFANRWGNVAFTEYVSILEQQADAVLETASETVEQQAESVFVRIAQLENAFWQMAFTGGQ